jgi:hypothetical protein
MAVEPLLVKLNDFITGHPKRAFFGKPAREKEIASLEKAIGRRLPAAHRLFLSRHDGGFISLMGEKGQQGWNLGDARWNSNTFLGVKGIARSYRQLQKLAVNVFDWEGPWPYVPVLQTDGQETLVFGPPDRRGESPVLDAFHEVGPDEWDVAFKSFEALLRAYLKDEGDIDAVA